jgi:thioredoxin-related protein
MELKSNKNLLLRLMSFIIPFFIYFTVLQGEARIYGAKEGEWTMDYDAALALSKKLNKKILLKFTRRNCGACISMEKNIFTQKSFIDYATRNLLLVKLDFSTKKSVVPKEFKPKNDFLADLFEIRGFPECIYIDSDGKTVLGKLGSKGDAKGFVKKLKILQVFTKKGSENFKKSYPNKAKDFDTAIKKLDELEASFHKWISTRPSKSAENDLRYKKLIAEINTAKKSLMKIVESTLL